MRDISRRGRRGRRTAPACPGHAPGTIKETPGAWTRGPRNALRRTLLTSPDPFRPEASGPFGARSEDRSPPLPGTPSLPGPMVTRSEDRVSTIEYSYISASPPRKNAPEKNLLWTFMWIFSEYFTSLHSFLWIICGFFCAFHSDAVESVLWRRPASFSPVSKYRPVTARSASSAFSSVHALSG